jgi:hypothetical protein
MDFIALLIGIGALLFWILVGGIFVKSLIFDRDKTGVAFTADDDVFTQEK